MANDGGMIAKLEQWMADTLKALYVFKTAEVWKHQVGATKAGMEAFARYSPFAFVGYFGTDTAREGDKDLRQILEFRVLIGITSKSDGVARFGSSRKLGTSKIRDLVIAAFDKVHPGGELTCDELYYTGDIEALDAPKMHAIEMKFETSFMTV
ncbi:MAG: hypothetical protein DRP65_00425 [Planctomycetota bacterium]|nr:MAG: hypothetical protein DRP65_00425 [Planctomycetota bacterium]